MKTFGFLVFMTFFSTAQASDYNWNYMDLGLNDDGEGGGPTFTISSDINENWFAQADMLRADYDGVNVENLLSFFSVGYQESSFFAKAGLARVDVCQYVCADDSGFMFMVGTATSNDALNAKLGIGMLDIIDDTWTIYEVDVSYALSDNLGVYLGLMGLDDLGDNTTRLGVRYSW